jgi:sporulation protein YlmC with PRC-barrel domain
MSLEIKELMGLVGTEVKNHKGKVLGKIDDIRIDEERKIPEYLILSCHDLFGGGKRYFAIPVQPFLINIGDNADVTIPVEREVLKVATGIPVDKWPKFDPEFTNSIFELLNYDTSTAPKKKKGGNASLKTR